MQFRIADTFTDSLARLTGDEQKAVKTTAFDLQLNPANPGMQFHKLNAARDPNFWSVRAGRDIRLIVHRSRDSLLLCYVDHHDKAYRWAERRKLETHPKTGAAQLVEIRETVQEIRVPSHIVEPQVSKLKPALHGFRGDELLEYGVPDEWLGDVLEADEDTLLQIAERLPAEAAEALLELATGGHPKKPTVSAGAVDPFEHPDAQRRFRVVANVDELTRALEFPWDKWAVFLHPAQRDIVEKDFNGPARVAGSAGTGKTIVALHRAVHLARSDTDARVLLTTFSDTLANALQVKLRRLISNEPRLAERMEVASIDTVGQRLYEANFGRQAIVTRSDIEPLLARAVESRKEFKFSLRFLLAEWEEVVDAWQLQTWEAYRDVRRLGRKTRLTEPQRRQLWDVFEQVKSTLAEQGGVTRAGMFNRLAETIGSRRSPPFDYAVVDESQDISVAQLRFLAAVGEGRRNALFFAGDLGQRIFQTPFSWKSLGVDVRGRSQTLRINYRTYHQIRRQADRLLGSQVGDVDGNVEDRRGTISVFNGPEPDVRVLDSEELEIATVGDWIADRIEAGVAAQEIGVFVRSEAQLPCARAAAEHSGCAVVVLDNNVETQAGHVSLSTMHLAKGLEFRAVAVMACDDEAIPLQERIETVVDDADLQEVYDTERHLLYVACTRARDFLLVTGVDPASEFLDDLRD